MIALFTIVVMLRLQQVGVWRDFGGFVQGGGEQEFITGASRPS